MNRGFHNNCIHMWITGRRFRTRVGVSVDGPAEEEGVDNIPCSVDIRALSSSKLSLVIALSSSLLAVIEVATASLMALCTSKFKFTALAVFPTLVIGVWAIGSFQRFVGRWLKSIKPIVKCCTKKSIVLSPFWLTRGPWSSFRRQITYDAGFSVTDGLTQSFKSQIEDAFGLLSLIACQSCIQMQEKVDEACERRGNSRSPNESGFIGKPRTLSSYSKNQSWARPFSCKDTCSSNLVGRDHSICTINIKTSRICFRVVNFLQISPKLLLISIVEAILAM